MWRGDNASPSRPNVESVADAAECGSSLVMLHAQRECGPYNASGAQNQYRPSAEFISAALSASRHVGINPDPDLHMHCGHFTM